MSLIEIFLLKAKAIHVYDYKKYGHLRDIFVTIGNIQRR